MVNPGFLWFCWCGFLVCHTPYAPEGVETFLHVDEVIVDLEGDLEPKVPAIIVAKPYEEAVLGRHQFWVWSCQTEGEVNLNHVFDEVQLAMKVICIMGSLGLLSQLFQSNLHLRYQIFQGFFLAETSVYFSTRCRQQQTCRLRLQNNWSKIRLAADFFMITSVRSEFVG